MASLNRMVLPDPWGAPMFSGRNALSEPPPTLRMPPKEAEDEPIPETLRSSVLACVHEPPRSIEISFDEAGEEAARVRARQDDRAA